MDPFSKRLWQICGDGLLSVGITLGYELGIFEALAAVSSKDTPTAPSAVAEKANLKERYVREWLRFMACGDIIEADKDGEHFWIPAERIPMLVGSSCSELVVFQSNTLMVGSAYQSLKEIFKKEGPLGMVFEKFDDFYERLGQMAERGHKRFLFSDYLALTGMADGLTKGGLQVLDVGCGSGMHISEFAARFPKCSCMGVDVSKDAVNSANQRKAKFDGGLPNLEFLQMDAMHLDKDWTNRFEFIMDFNACHDLTRPDLSLKETYRVLKPGGTFCLLETDATGNVSKDKVDPRALFMYGVSTFMCLPAGSNAPDALCLGAMWGRDLAVKMLKEAGFSKVEVIPTPFYETSVLYKCAK